jgi:hypothetical protein
LYLPPYRRHRGAARGLARVDDGPADGGGGEAPVRRRGGPTPFRTEESLRVPCPVPRSGIGLDWIASASEERRLAAWTDGLDTHLREDLEALRQAIHARRLVLVVGDALPGGDGGIRAAVEAEVRRIERTDLKEELEEKLAQRLPLSVTADDLDAALLHDRLRRESRAGSAGSASGAGKLGGRRGVDEGRAGAKRNGEGRIGTVLCPGGVPSFVRARAARAVPSRTT